MELHEILSVLMGGGIAGGGAGGGVFAYLAARTKARASAASDAVAKEGNLLTAQGGFIAEIRAELAQCRQDREAAQREHDECMRQWAAATRRLAQIEVHVGMPPVDEETSG